MWTLNTDTLSAYRGRLITLMCKNIKVCSFYLYGEVEVYRQDLLPFSLRCFTDRYQLSSEILRWMELRVLTISRKHAKEILLGLNLQQYDNISVCLACHGLSLVDCYWLDYGGLNWEKVNLYGNSFSKAMSDISLTGYSSDNITIQSRMHTPELGDNGSFAKCWRRNKGSIYLYKAGSGNKEEYCEVLCSMILDVLDIPHVEYTLSKLNGISVSRCKLITSDERSICTAGEFIGYCGIRGIDINEILYQSDDFWTMIIVDYLIWNVDRHQKNWGFFFSPNNGKIIDIHPLFDHNLSLRLRKDRGSYIFTGKSLEESAKYAKGYYSLDISKLINWLNDYGKKIFMKYFEGLNEYNALMERINKYESW